MSEPPDPTPATLPDNSGFGLNLLTIAAAVIIAAALMLVFNGRHLMDHYARWRAGQAAAEAVKLMENQRFEAAAQLLQGVLRHSPDEPALLRATAELFLRAYDDPQSALAFQRKVVSTPLATPADQRKLGEILLLTGDTSGAKRLYQALPDAERESRRGMELSAGILRAQGQTDEALQLLRQAWQRPPQDIEARLRLAMLDEAQAFESAQAQAGSTLWEVARLDDPAALIAIEHLCQSSQLTAQQAAELKSLVEEHPRTNDRLRYAMLRAYLRLNVLDRDRVIAAEEARNAGKPAEEKFDFLRWLGLEGEHDRLLRLLPRESISLDADLFLLYVDALSAAGEWDTLLKLVQTGKPPISAPTTQVIQAQCYARLQPDLLETRRHLRSALDLCGRGETAIVLRAAALAEQQHLNDLAVEGYRTVAAARPTLRRGLLEKVLGLLRLEQDLPGMIATLQELRALRPGSQSYADELNYLRLVSGMEMETACEEVLGFQKTAADKPAPSATLPPELLQALAAWRFGQNEAMLQALGKLAQPERMAPGQRAVLAALYTISGREVEGFRLAEKIPPLTLLEPEGRFLQRSLR